MPARTTNPTKEKSPTKEQSPTKGLRVGSRWRVMPVPPTFRGTSVQVCGFWPFAGGSSRPAVGVPVGQDIQTGSTVCCDPFSWFRAGFISSPSMAIFGMPGLGKSSFAARQMIGLADQGAITMVCDLKGEYSPLCRALGGQVLDYGRGYRVNLLDLGAMGDAAKRIGGPRGQALRELAVARAVDAVATQVQIVRRSAVTDWEQTLLTAAVWQLDHAYRRRKAAPTLGDLAQLLHDPSEAMQAAIITDNSSVYAELTTGLRRSLQAVLQGPLGRMYDGQSTARLQTDTPMVSVDVSAVSRQSETILSSAMLASWSEMFSTIEAANALTDAGLEPQRHYLVVLDEMWRAMRLEGAELVEKADGITRLNRNEGVGNLFITHSLRDLESMTTKADNTKARGFAERSGIVVTAGLAKEDLRALSEVKRMSEVEIATVAGWSTPPGWRSRQVRGADGRTRPAPPPGAGKVLIKLGERAGIQTQVRLTRTELDLHDTNNRWLGAAS